MDNKVNALKEKQQSLGDKINMLHETQKKKEEEAEKIRALIAECRENLNRIKREAIAPNQQRGTADNSKRPCSSLQAPSGSSDTKNINNRLEPCFSGSVPNETPCGNNRSPPNSNYESITPCQERKRCCSQEQDPCSKYLEMKGAGYNNKNASTSNYESITPCQERKRSCSQEQDPCSKYLEMKGAGCNDKNSSNSNYESLTPCQERKRYSQEQEPCSKYLEMKGTGCNDRNDPTKAIESQINALAEATETSRKCIDTLGEKMEKEIKMKITSGSDNPCLSLNSPREPFHGSNDLSYQERVSCRVDLRKLKVNVRGCPEDLKKLDAVQLVNLLDKFQCRELVINTSDYQDQQQGTSMDRGLQNGPGEVPIFYILHPGNIVLIVGVAMVAFLLNTNLCSTQRECRTRFLLNMLYLGSFAFHYGIVLWMSFIRGLTLSAGLSPEIFNTVDNLILPKYFSICVFLSAITLYSFLATHCEVPCTSWSLPVLVQVLIESSTFLTELVAICYIVPAIVKLRKATNEYATGVHEAPLPESYCKNVEKLAKLNWAITLINTLTAMFMGASIYYVSSKLNIS